MKRMMLVENDQAMRTLVHQELGDLYEIVETGDSTEALALALETEPDFIVLDLMLPRFSGMELCQTLASVSNTQQIPVFVLAGRSSAEHRDHCLHLGAKDFFESPVDFARLKQSIATALCRPPKERRKEPRIRLKVVLKLAGTAKTGKQFEMLTATDDVSIGGFLCRCPAPVEKGTVVEVYLISRGDDTFAGKAEIIHVHWEGMPWQSCGCKLIEKTGAWVL